MSRRRGSATALNASEVVAALATLSIYSDIGICQVFFTRLSDTLFPAALPLKIGLYELTGNTELDPVRSSYTAFLAIPNP
jgi:hypothetical protein